MLSNRCFLLLNILVINLAIFSLPEANAYTVRLKDVLKFEGIRDNLLLGYGLVVGLNGTGDNLANSIFTKKGLTEFLGRMGVNVKGDNLKTRNVAAVMITANLPPFARQGSRIDVTVSTIGDAKSLSGGVLLATPLLGADGQVYAVAQGALSIGGFSAINNNGNTTINKGIPTNGFIANGAIIEQEIAFQLSSLQSVNLSLNNPDITTSTRVAELINIMIEDNTAMALDPATINLKVPDQYNGNVLGLLAEIEKIEITPDLAAKVVIEEASGTIVIGENVRISPVAIAQGNLIIKITENNEVNQPGAFAPEGAETVVVQNPMINVDESRGAQLRMVDGGATLRDLINGLNSLGVSPRDLITILQNIKAAGALQATIEVR